MTSEFLRVAKMVLSELKRPLRAREIVDIAIKKQLFSDQRAGRTPHQTMKSKLSVHIRRHGDHSEFVRTAPGRFYLRELLEAGQTSYAAKPIIKPPATELVLCVNAGWFPEDTRFHGITSKFKPHYRHLLSDAACTYLPRHIAEQTEEYKQILTYVMVTRGESVLCYTRGNYNRVEDSLRGARCIGFGGHVVNEDKTLFTESGMGIWEAAARELSEELKLPKHDRDQLRNGQGLRLAGILNDDSSSNGRKHLAFLFKYEVAPDSDWRKPLRGEKSITHLGWLSSSSTPHPLWDFEYWSQLCLRRFFPTLVKMTPAVLLRRRLQIESPHIVCIAGAVGSGKSEATRVLTEKYGYHEINSGRILARLLGMPQIPATPREVFSKAAAEFIGRPDGPEQLAHEIARDARRHSNSLLLIDGIRHKRTIEAIKREFPNRKVVIIFVEAPPDIAFELYRRRERKTISFAQFNSIRGSNSEQEVADLIGLADAVLYNSFGIEAYRRTIHSMIEQSRR